MKDQFVYCLLLLLSEFANASPLAELLRDLHHSNPDCVWVVSSEMSFEDLNLAASSMIISSELEDNVTKDVAIALRSETCVILLTDQNHATPNLIRGLLSQVTKKVAIVLCFDKISCNRLALNNDIVVVETWNGGLFYLSSTCTQSPQLSKAMVWSEQRRMKEINPFQFVCDRTLSGQKVNVSAFATFPYSAYFDQDDEFRGSDIEVMKALAAKFNFEMSITRQQPWVRNPDTGKWSGMVGEILAGRSHFGIGPFGINMPANDLDISFSPMVYTIDIIFLTNKPSPLEPFFNFSKTFSAEMWIVMAISLVLSIFVYHYMEESNGSWIKTSLRLFATQVSQGIKRKSTSKPFLFFFGSWLLYCLFICLAFECSLRAHLIKVEYERPIDTEQDLIESGKDLYLPQGMSVTLNYQLSATLTKKTLFRRSLTRGTIFAYNRGIMDPKAEQRMVTFGGARPYVKDRISFGMMDMEKRFGFQPFRQGKALIAQEYGAYLIPKFKPWTAEVGLALLRMVEAGLYQHWISLHTPINKYSFNMKEENNDLEPFQVEHIVGTLTLLASGYLLSSIAFIWEQIRQRIGHSS